MQKNFWSAVAGVAAFVALVSTPALAHHAFSAEFDATRPVKLQGAVTKVELVNPHAWVHIEVTKADGATACEYTPNAKCQAWMVEGGTPNTLQRRGITRDTIKIGTVIIVEGFQSKDGTMKANGRNMIFPDGRTLFMGSSGTGAPKDGRDPTEK